MISPAPHVLITTATAPKVGIRSSGSVRYQILSDADHMEIYLARLEDRTTASRRPCRSACRPHRQYRP